MPDDPPAVGLPATVNVERRLVLHDPVAPPSLEPELRRVYELLAMEYRYTVGDGNLHKKKMLEEIGEALMLLAGKAGVSAMSFPRLSTCCGGHTAEIRPDRPLPDLTEPKEERACR